MRLMFDPYLGKTYIGKKEKEKTGKVLDSGTLFRYQPDSKKCREVEERLESMFNVKHALLVTNATNALKLALLALKPTPGGIVLIPALSYIATANACLSAGLIPVCLDVDDSGHLCPEVLENYLQKNEKPFAVMAVHLDGTSAQIERIAEICQKFNVPLIEDAAQAFGVKHQGRYVGTFGDVGCFSFQENKILSTGEGGAILTNNQDLFDRICSLSDHGASRKESCYQDWKLDHGFGENFKVSEVTAALLDAQLDHFPQMKESLWDEYKKGVERYKPATSRNEGDIPLSIWMERGVDVPHYNWNHLYLPDHPILREKRSPYADRFPWNLRTHPEMPTPKSKFISDMRISVPVIPTPLQGENA